jgi:hypothetical protein
MAISDGPVISHGYQSWQSVTARTGHNSDACNDSDIAQNSVV